MSILRKVFALISQSLLIVAVLIVGIVICTPPAKADTLLGVIPSEVFDSRAQLTWTREEVSKSTQNAGLPFKSPIVLESKDNVLSVELEAKYVKDKIGPDPVCLRSYKLLSSNAPLSGQDPDTLLLVGPTLKVKPGDLLQIKIVNELNDKDCNESAGTKRAAVSPSKFNITNLHTHGLEVSPTGNSDNVYVGIEPGKSFQYEFAIPDDHPPGTFWYHPHYHESTAMQVSSGMAGTLIVEGTDARSLDKVLGTLNIKGDYDKVFVFQQIPYQCKRENDIKEDQSSVVSVDCPPNEVRLVQHFFASFNPNQWTTLGRHSTINGQLLPRITMQPGEVQRWRFIHAGVQETLNLSLCKEGDCKNSNKDSNPPKLMMREIAVDGLAVGKTHYEKEKDEILLEPGYRSDVLVKAPEKAGLYKLVDRPVGPDKSVMVTTEAKDVIALVEIEDATPSSNGIATNLPTELPKADNLKAQFEHIEAHKVDRRRVLSFNLDCSTGKCQSQVDDKEYDHNELPLALNVGNTEEWTLVSLNFNHPFHIHVNPFEVITRNEKGEETGVWRDTILVTPDHPVTIRTKYKKYIGGTVLHCHLLDHEDLGMMKAVEFRN
ncbi:multicopper oxidase family protein [Microcoleus sp. OTE_8_concoct_300]|uniref:multicopper oxidase family protein n=1 Tax=Microcoleus sp. OTE_8_concoct_300 TaxID=2964710 RepID=UPI00403EFBCC